MRKRTVKKSQVAGKARRGSDHSQFATRDRGSSNEGSRWSVQNKQEPVLYSTAELVVTSQPGIVYVMSSVCVTSDGNWTT